MCHHFNKIAKRTFTRLWDTLSMRDRQMIAADVDKENELSKWFYATVASETKAKFENTDYWFNDPYSFKYPLREESV